MDKLWAIIPGTLEAIESSRKNHVDSEAFLKAQTTRQSEEMTVIDGVAHIMVTGVLTKSPDWFAMFFGGGNTVYGDIIEQLMRAEDSDKVDSVVLEIDSPGGQISGMFDVMDTIAAMDKPITAHVTDMAASAAYGIASQADSIIANNNTAIIGSVGVVRSAYLDKSIVNITSTEAPNKRPDLSTDEGIEAVRKELDEVHQQFAERIATGRSAASDTTLSAEDVNKDFGRGGTMLAESALKAGMIDGISASRPVASNKAAKQIETALCGGETKEAKLMNLKELQATHPDLYDEAVSVGVNQERDRTGAHLILGKQSGDLDTAIQAIEDGSEMTATLQAKYMAAGMSRKDQEARAEEDQEVDSGKPQEDNASEDERVRSELASAWGGLKHG